VQGMEPESVRAVGHCESCGDSKH